METIGKRFNITAVQAEEDTIPQIQAEEDTMVPMLEEPEEAPKKKK